MQIGFARLVTDSATFAWLCDVIVDPGHRGKGLGKWLVECATSHPDIATTTKLLRTRDAHGLYEKYGFAKIECMMRQPPAPAAKNGCWFERLETRFDTLRKK